MVQPDEADTYSPDAIRYYLTHWRALSEMSVGTSNGLQGRSTGGSPGGRVTFAIIKADVERAADALPIYWQSTAWIFKRQGRSQEYRQRRLVEPDPTDRQYESPIPSEALEHACYHMSLALGWRSETTLKKAG